MFGELFSTSREFRVLLSSILIAVSKGCALAGKDHQNSCDLDAKTAPIYLE